MTSPINDSVELKRAYEIQLIKILKDLPCLWNQNHPDYKKKCVRNAAIERLAEIGRQFNYNYTNTYLMKQVQIYRRGYLRTHKKVLEATSSHPFVPRLWYYNDMSFMSQAESAASGSGGSHIENCYVIREDTLEGLIMTLLKRQQKEHSKFMKQLSAGLLSKPYNVRAKMEEVYLELLNKTDGIENLYIILTNYGVQTEHQYNFHHTPQSDFPIVTFPTLEEQERYDVQETINAINSIV